MSGLMTSKTHNPRGYAFIAFNSSYTRHLGYNWFATLYKSNLTPTRHEWIGDGLRLYDRMQYHTDITDESLLLDMVAEIEKGMSGSVRETAKGRIFWPSRGKMGFDRVFLSLDKVSPAILDPGSSAAATYAQMIPEPADTITEWDDWDALGFRLRRLWPVLSATERKYVAALVEEPDASMTELAAKFGNVRQMADLTMKRVRVKAQKLEARA